MTVEHDALSRALYQPSTTKSSAASKTAEMAPRLRSIAERHRRGAAGEALQLKVPARAEHCSGSAAMAY